MDGTAPPALLAELLHEPPRPAPRRRSALLALAGVVTAGALGTAGWAGTAWLRDADLRGALGTAALAVEDVVGQAVEADDARDLVRLAGDAEAAVGQLDRARQRAQRSDRPDAPAVVDEIEAQRDVLLSLAPLEGVGRGALQAWGRARVPLREALLGEARTRARLGRDRPGDAERLAVLDALGPALDAAAVPLLQRAAQAELVRLGGVLRDARSTADVRAAAQIAADQADAVRRSAGVGQAAAADLARCASVLAALSTLTGLSGAAPDAWAAARGPLEALRAPDALAHVDALVATATGAQQQYLAQAEAAAAAREADALALAQHGTAVRGLASGYAARDAALLSLLAALAARQATETDLAALAADAEDRARLAAALTGLVAPPAVVAEHATLVSAASAEAAAVQALTVAVSAGDGDDAALTALVAQRAQATAARAEALRSWDEATVRAAALVDKRPAPEPPAL